MEDTVLLTVNKPPSTTTSPFMNLLCHITGLGELSWHTTQRKTPGIAHVQHQVMHPQGYEQMLSF